RDSEEFHVVHIRLQVVFSRTLGGIETTKQILRFAEDSISVLGQRSNFVINFTQYRAPHPDLSMRAMRDAINKPIITSHLLANGHFYSGKRSL
ncbi:MAG: hypothetical protein AB2793_13330, partial [Candidatus Thiodiazotropha sp.]